MLPDILKPANRIYANHFSASANRSNDLLGEFFLLKTQGNMHFWQKQRQPGAELENPAFLPVRPFLRKSLFHLSLFC
jgi:hypothetical protein